jgi:glycerol-3-phosphate acyltransferase PlsY
MTLAPHAEAISFATAALAYALGSIPFGLLLTRAAGLGDIRAIGSGNIGATNVLRTGNKGLAAATLLLDAAKAVAAVQLVRLIFGPAWEPLAAIAAVVGHCFPVWLSFKGGKGVASGLGALLALYWPLGAAACGAWLAAFALTRISSAGAIAALLVAPIAAIFWLPAFWWVAPWLNSAIILWRHRENISRLLAGTEPRFGGRP